MPEKLIIIGAGPAGLTAALYAGRAFLEPLVFVGPSFGGQIATTTDVENFPGFPSGLQGPELAALMREQAEKFGARMVEESIVKVDFSQRPFRLWSESGEHEALAVIIATGATPRKLGVPGEDAFVGRGVSYCATCDGFFFRDKEIIVVGGGDSAFQEGLFLTKFGRRVRIVHRRDEFRANPTLQRRAMENPKIEFIKSAVVERILGDGKVTEVQLRSTKTGEQWTTPVDGVFIFIGHEPNTQLFKGQLAMTEEGYLVVDQRLHTSVPGVFAAGEVHDNWFKQAITSAGFGCMAAMEAEKYLSSL
ncbi:MAG: thioredoxin-disulfide reductase [Thermoflexales bacterium]|nr:thioredoxin-disulfide reductase [Thermoflexales bacterium]MCS7323994.1 thioredoxin-disulfide reductase [Thermoflexales bacterium]MDW8052934.1 thioredoxin-disulfide reductase [Anaerolineae bacterium]MDW8291585.1 thioredoxin-disulfide reductase [Anaerolineae bacterium]